MTVKFSIEAGVLVRGPIMRQLKQWAFVHNYQLEVKEDKRLLESTYYIKLVGAKKEDVMRFMKQVADTV